VQQVLNCLHVIFPFNRVRQCTSQMTVVREISTENFKDLPGTMPNPFSPPLLLQNRNLQTTLASLWPRRLLASRRGRPLLRHSRELILNCGDGIRLLGEYSARADNRRGLVTLIHGWEGSSNSGYILSAAGVLFDSGYNVFRLNLRDHGPSHHLNRELFNSTRLAEVVAAVGEIHRLFPHQRTFLAGFSLGGNFALRIGLHAPEKGISLTAIAALCPLIDPVAATRNLEENHPVYHRYFVRKWRRSLLRKLTIHPGLDDPTLLRRRHTLSALHDHFVPRHTEYKNTKAYLSAYRLDAGQLDALRIPTTIIATDDDPILPRRQFDQLEETAWLRIERVRYGGHCGFLENFHLTSWADYRLKELFEQSATITKPENTPTPRGR
jgi:uncharacterized protein